MAQPTELLRENRYGLEIECTVLWCAACGVGQTVPELSAEELSNLYRQCYTPSEEEIRAAAKRLMARARRGDFNHRSIKLWRRANGDALLPFVSSLPPGSRLLDVGCGRGEVLAAAISAGLPEPIGLEPNSRAASALADAGFKVISATLEDLPAGLAPFDVVLMSHVLEHVPDPIEILRRATQVLSPGGEIALYLPNTEAFTRRLFGPHWAHWHVPFHRHHFTPWGVRRVLSAAGLLPTSIRHHTLGDWMLLSWDIAQNARHGRFRLESGQRRLVARLLLAPVGRLMDGMQMGDALFIRARRIIEDAS